jgi:HPt (histidine-containing phosphotransfer) domain-containing protein
MVESKALKLAVFARRAGACARLSVGDRGVFVESVTRDLQVIEDSWHQRDETRLLERIHSLKGALLILGEEAVANDCAVVERCIRVEDADACDSAIETIKHSLRRLLALYGAN